MSSGDVDGIVLSLPIADRMRAMLFYREVFGFEALGEPAEDGVPEPLQFEIGRRTRLMLIPSGGFGWVLGEGREVAPTKSHEVLLSLTVGAPRAVDDVIGRARRAGGEIVAEPQRQPWGYTGVCADPDGHLWQVIVAAAATS
ncbi:VOC family protein [Nocardiopsis lambiniae]|uniref:VOC family protein n=1 Tax=Nocardiopsis lambiniae TaxID=3075539 RepID=A0ABU2MBC8_9ACTN|nr:VOC family protein [Nocardiopsis sp. DSM 44743]MDT0329256.1 VOC family protein [Nocardiopsis sp. DSM 44743]